MKIVREKHRFVVKESADGHAYVTIEPVNTKERALNLYLAADSSIEAASAIARYLNEKITSIGFAA